MELIDMPHKKDAKQLNRLIHVTGHWAQPIPETELRDLFRSLVGGSIVEAALTGEESKTRASVVCYPKLLYHTPLSIFLISMWLIEWLSSA